MPHNKFWNIIVPTIGLLSALALALAAFRSVILSPGEVSPALAVATIAACVAFKVLFFWAERE